VDDGPVAAAAAPGLAGPELDAACHAVLGLPPDAAIAVPAWWDATAPARRVTYVRRASAPLPPSPWPVRRALDFCAALALALAPLHEAGVSHGALRPDAVSVRPAGGPLICAPMGAGTPGGDLRGLGELLLLLLTGRPAGASVIVSGEAGPAREAAALLEGLLAPDPHVRPASAREVAARLSAIAASVPDTTPAAETVPARPARRRARVATALVLLAVAGGAGALVLTQRVGPPGPALSPGTVTVPEPPAVTP
jgi:hypothetical protein